MPFEPLKTDEPYDGPKIKKNDFENHLMGGCAFVTVTAFLVYGLVSWPYLVFPVHTVPGMQDTLIYGMLPAMILGMIATRKAGPAGVAGFLGGALCSSVFTYLRLQEIMLGKSVADLPAPEWPDRLSWAIPLGGALAAVILALAIYPYRKKYQELS
ncbi:MAG: hypothetical protein KF812_06815 [Fimbriimonadaceae bacterium]|nr:hypothetical protein [Fimbriimonadaceae bacterium]